MIILRAAAAALLLVAAIAAPVVAECVTLVCGDEAPRADRLLDFGVAFTARVIERSDDVDAAPPDSSPYRWHVELDVDHIYRGDVPRKLSWNGYNPHASTFRAARLATGDRVFVAAERYLEPRAPTDPFEGDVVVWIRADDGWSFARRLLTHSDDPSFYPAAARAADSLAEILAVVRSARLPDTSTIAPSPPATVRPDGALVVLLAAVVGLALGLRRTRAKAQPALGEQ